MEVMDRLWFGHGSSTPTETGNEFRHALPPELIDKIINKILNNLPFSRLLSFCCFSKRWREFLLSNHYLLYFHRGECVAFNPRRESWESVSLQFCKQQGFRLRKLLVTSFCGGLLVFAATDSNGHREFLLCNPLTKCCRRLGARSTDEQTLRREKILGSRLRVHTSWLLARSSAFKQVRDGRRELPFTEPVHLVVDIAVRWKTETFVVSIFNIRLGVGHVYDSRCPSWIGVYGLPEDFRFITSGPVMLSKGSVALGFGTDPASFKVLVYDLKLKLFGWRMSMETLVSALKREGITSIVTFNCADESQVFEVQDTGHSLALVGSAVSRFPLEKICKEMVQKVPNRLQAFLRTRLFFSLSCVGLGEKLFCIGILTGSPQYAFDVISIVMPGHIEQQNSEMFRVFTYEVRKKLPPVTDFHILQPSFAFPL